ncbi:MAG: DUF1858 domain-containing protein [Anaerofustis sp.]|jgi:hybrid cluster-associated redox disulfide protein
MITGDMNIVGVIKMFPETIEVFQSSGMGCIGCLAAKNETIAQGALAHEVDLDVLMYRLNDAVIQKKNAQA